MGGGGGGGGGGVETIQIFQRSEKGGVEMAEHM